jgi:hypothetical protein
VHVILHQAIVLLFVVLADLVVEHVYQHLISFIDAVDLTSVLLQVG